jgi:hypothetical protein
MTGRFSEALGKPGEGAHVHVCGIAVWDVLMTLVVAFIIAYYFNIPVLYSFVGLLIIGEVVHAALGVDTAIVKLFTSSSS